MKDLSSSASYEILENADSTKLIIKGRIDENTKLPNVLAKGQPLHIDLGGVTGVNSVGCRQWAIWIKNLKRGGATFLHKCPPIFINQVNILIGLLPDDFTVESFYVPYHCESCGAEEVQLFERGRHFQTLEAINVQEQIICPVCSALMELDVVKERYFGFLRRKSA